MQGDSLLLIGIVAFGIIFLVAGGLLYFYGWRFITFRLIGGTISNLLGKVGDNPEERNIAAPPRMDAQTAIEQLPDFHATVAQYRNDEKLTTSEVHAAEGETASSDTTFTADPGPEMRKDEAGVRYSSDSPNRLLRDKRYERVRGPESDDPPQVYPGMFEEK
jgi:hypothetical protein